MMQKKKEERRNKRLLLFANTTTLQLTTNWMMGDRPSENDRDEREKHSSSFHHPIKAENEDLFGRCFLVQLR
jgi:hypothetical protein